MYFWWLQLPVSIHKVKVIPSSYLKIGRKHSIMHYNALLKIEKEGKSSRYSGVARTHSGNPWIKRLAKTTLSPTLPHPIPLEWDHGYPIEILNSSLPLCFLPSPCPGLGFSGTNYSTQTRPQTWSLTVWLGVFCAVPNLCFQCKSQRITAQWNSPGTEQ